MITSFTDLFEQLTTYFNELFEQKVKENKYRPELVNTSIDFFVSQYLQEYDGSEPIQHSTFREFLDYNQAALDYRFGVMEEVNLARIKYLTPQPVKTVTDGEIPAVVQNLVITGANVKPTVTSDPSLMPSDTLFNYTTNIVKGQFAYNEDDDIWYYRRKDNTIASLVGLGTFNDGIYTLNQSLTTLDGALGNAITDYNSKITLSAQGLQVAFDETIFVTDENGNRVLDGEGNPILHERFTSVITNTAREFTVALSDLIFDSEGDLATSFNSKVAQTAQSISTTLEQKIFDENDNIKSQYFTETLQTAQGYVTTLTSILFGEGSPDTIASISQNISNETADSVSRTISKRLFGTPLTQAQIDAGYVEGQSFTDQFSTISQTVDEIVLQIQEITADGEGNIETFASKIQQLSDRIDLSVKYTDFSEVTGQYYSMQSNITQSADTIALIVQEIGTNGVVNAASIITAINNGTSEIKINADKLNITAETIFKSASKVFQTTPTVPYKIGDIWFGSVTKICTQPRDGVVGTQGEFFNASDWTKYDSYDNTTTVINGGLITTGTIKLGAGGIENAGITGYDTQGIDIRIWAGSTFASRDTAPFRVDQDGNMFCTKATITGAINNHGFSASAEGDVVVCGDFSIYGNSLSNGHYVVDTEKVIIHVDHSTNTLHIGQYGTKYTDTVVDGIIDFQKSANFNGSLVAKADTLLSYNTGGKIMIYNIPSAIGDAVTGQVYKDSNGFLKLK